MTTSGGSFLFASLPPHFLFTAGGVSTVCPPPVMVESAGLGFGNTSAGGLGRAGIFFDGGLAAFSG